MGFRPGFLFDGGEAKELVPLKLLYVIHYFAFSMQTYLPIYFDTTANFSKAQIGVLLSIPCICAIVSPPVWGAIADGIHNQKLAHTVCLVSAAFLFFSIQYVTSFPLMCAMVFIANFQTQPSFSLLDHAAMAWLERVGGDYGKQRLYGAAGYGAGGYFASVVASSLGIEWCFNMVLILSSVSLFLLLTYVPNIQHEAEHHQKGELLKSLKAILHQHDVLVLFVIVILAGITGGLIDNYLFLYYFNLSGNDAHIVGVVIAIETISELPFFFHANKIIERFGTPKCVFVSLIAYGIRMITYMFVQHPWLVLPVEVLHGLTYGLLLAAFTNYIYEAAPKGTEGTMIGVLFAVQRGIGGGLSTLVGGWIYGALGGRTMWGIAGFIVFPLSLVFTAGFACLARNYAAQSPTASKEDSGSITSDESSLLATSADYGTTDTAFEAARTHPSVHKPGGKDAAAIYAAASGNPSESLFEIPKQASPHGSSAIHWISAVHIGIRPASATKPTVSVRSHPLLQLKAAEDVRPPAPHRVHHRWRREQAARAAQALLRHPLLRLLHADLPAYLLRQHGALRQDADRHPADAAVCVRHHRAAHLGRRRRRDQEPEAGSHLLPGLGRPLHVLAALRVHLQRHVHHALRGQLPDAAHVVAAGPDGHDHARPHRWCLRQAATVRCRGLRYRWLLRWCHGRCHWHCLVLQHGAGSLGHLALHPAAFHPGIPTRRGRSEDGLPPVARHHLGPTGRACALHCGAPGRYSGWSYRQFSFFVLLQLVWKRRETGGCHHRHRDHFGTAALLLLQQDLRALRHAQLHHLQCRGLRHPYDRLHVRAQPVGVAPVRGAARHDVRAAVGCVHQLHLPVVPRGHGRNDDRPADRSAEGHGRGLLDPDGRLRVRALRPACHVGHRCVRGLPAGDPVLAHLLVPRSRIPGEERRDPREVGQFVQFVLDRYQRPHFQEERLHGDRRRAGLVIFFVCSLPSLRLRCI